MVTVRAAPTPARWTALAESVEPELCVASGPGEWSAVECLHHLVETERRVFRCGWAISLGKDFEAFNPEARDAGRAAIDAGRLAGDFEQLRGQPCVAVAPRAYRPGPDHTPELGRVTRELIREWAGRDLMHAVQAEHLD
jgi:hypothetical protein